MTQLPLNLSGDICARRHRGNRQSAAAHDRIRPAKISLREQVRQYIAAQGEMGATVEEISEGLGVRYTTVSGRASELKAMQLIEESGRTRPTSGGIPAAVLVTKG